MKTLQRSLCVVVVLFGLTTACGKDEKKATPPTLPNTTTTVAANRAVSTTTPPTTIANVTDGATCPAPNVRGVTKSGIPEVCGPIAGGNDLRWRPL